MAISFPKPLKLVCWVGLPIFIGLMIYLGVVLYQVFGAHKHPPALSLAAAGVCAWCDQAKIQPSPAVIPLSVETVPLRTHDQVAAMDFPGPLQDKTSPVKFVQSMTMDDVVVSIGAVTLLAYTSYTRCPLGEQPNTHFMSPLRDTCIPADSMLHDYFAATKTIKKYFEDGLYNPPEELIKETECPVGMIKNQLTMVPPGVFCVPDGCAKNAYYALDKQACQVCADDEKVDKVNRRCNPIICATGKYYDTSEKQCRETGLFNTPCSTLPFKSSIQACAAIVGQDCNVYYCAEKDIDCKLCVKNGDSGRCKDSGKLCHSG